MRSEFKAKLIQHMFNKRNSEKGFTLIELLVVIIIIGILAAIALPSFLNQTSKAKQGEAKTYVTTINRTEAAYYTEKTAFGALSNLALGTPGTTTNYDYVLTITPGVANGALANVKVDATSLKPTLKYYVGGVGVGNDLTSNQVSVSVVCEASLAAVGASAATPAYTMGVALPTAACPANSVLVQ